MGCANAEYLVFKLHIGKSTILLLLTFATPQLKPTLPPTHITNPFNAGPRKQNRSQPFPHRTRHDPPGKAHGG
jgi:hypothetical protein